jgi:REP element-mobilizing transposase RayT
MILAYHAIFTTYGFWLPNDPRGSWSEFVGSWDLYQYGSATTTNIRRSLASKPHDRALREAAKTALKYPAVHFDGEQALAVSKGFANAINEHHYKLYACSILPEHVHIVAERCDRPVERVVTHLKSKATSQLVKEGKHPLASFVSRRGGPPTPWAENCWKCFLDSDEDIARAVRYVENNPVKEGKRLQHWSFVVPREIGEL